MQSYEHTQQRLLALNVNSTYPPLTDEDLYMKPVLQKRRVGDSQHTDGALWRIYPQIPPDEVIETGQNCEEILKYGKCTGNLSTTGTQMDRRRTGSTRTRSTPSQAPKKTVDERPDGWLWQLGKLCKITDAEMDAWSHEGEDTFDGLFHTYLTLPEGDRVQWFRAEAEMQRWQEQCEQKLAELLRTNRSFLKMADTWTTVASQTAAACSPGHSAYAKQKAVMHHRRAEAAQALITAADNRDLLGPNANLVDRVQKERSSHGLTRQMKPVACELTHQPPTNASIASHSQVSCMSMMVYRFSDIALVKFPGGLGFEPDRPLFLPTLGGQTV
ncbi:hypothetical protein C8R45DRAFT_933261 [Mycena sanguinolenta]|nr:hypothetical protein C8R45DRAFT_933261 [Mycena sanguinolenta]